MTQYDPLSRFSLPSFRLPFLMALCAIVGLPATAASITFDPLPPPVVVDPDGTPTDVFVHNGRNVFTGYLEDDQPGIKTPTVWVETAAGSDTYTRQTFKGFTDAQVVTGVSDFEGNASILVVDDLGGGLRNTFVYSDTGVGGSFGPSSYFAGGGQVIGTLGVEDVGGRDMSETLTVVALENPGEIYVQRDGTAVALPFGVGSQNAAEVISSDGTKVGINANGQAFIVDITPAVPTVISSDGGIAYAGASNNFFVGLNGAGLNPFAVDCTVGCGSPIDIALSPGYIAAEFIGVRDFGPNDGIGLIQAFDSGFATDYFAVQMSALPADLLGATMLSSLSGMMVTGFDIEMTGTTSFALTVALDGSVLGQSFTGNTAAIPLPATVWMLIAAFCSLLKSVRAGVRDFFRQVKLLAFSVILKPAAFALGCLGHIGNGGSASRRYFRTFLVLK